jgi:hypothetical protein
MDKGWLGAQDKVRRMPMEHDSAANLEFTISIPSLHRKSKKMKNHYL